MHDVFISYCREDVDLMKAIWLCLKKYDLIIWVDENIELGLDWRRDISIAIKDTRCLVVIMTPYIQDSRWVREELAYAETHGKPVYPLLASGDAKSSVPFGYMSSNWIDITGEDICGPKLRKLATTIKNKYGLGQNDVEEFQPLVKMTGNWQLEYTGAGFTGTGFYHFDEHNNFRATVFNPIFSENEIQEGTWKIENNALITQGTTSLRGKSMPFRAAVKIIKADIEAGVVDASVTSNGYELLGKLIRR
ncbi:MAG: toll/interleukin-1 receptor domain-containing protein [Anaerolineae bacterium]|nr:toll/interleukin-1 receptor domain-containing protein [Anaerolineae bacterium]